MCYTTKTKLHETITFKQSGQKIRKYSLHTGAPHFRHAKLVLFRCDGRQIWQCFAMCSCWALAPVSLTSNQEMCCGWWTAEREATQVGKTPLRQKLDQTKCQFLLKEPPFQGILRYVLFIQNLRIEHGCIQNHIKKRKRSPFVYAAARLIRTHLIKCIHNTSSSGNTSNNSISSVRSATASATAGSRSLSACVPSLCISFASGRLLQTSKVKGRSSASNMLFWSQLEISINDRHSRIFKNGRHSRIFKNEISSTDLRNWNLWKGSGCSVFQNSTVLHDNN